MENVTMKVKEREGRGKEYVKQLRQANFSPGVIYGLGGDNLLVEFQTSLFEKLLKSDYGRNIVIDLSIERGEKLVSERVMIYDMERDCLTDQLIHVDFLRVKDDVPVKVTIPIRLVGVCPGVKQGGVLVQKMDSIVVKCDISEIPKVYDIDLSVLNVGDFITVQTLADQLSYSILSHHQDTIVRVGAPRVQIEGASEEAAGEVDEGSVAEESGEGDSGKEEVVAET